MNQLAKATFRVIFRYFIAFFMLAFGTAPTLAQEPAAPSPSATTANASAHPLTRDDLAAWLDGMLPYAIREGDIAGGVVSVVKDGQVLFEKGYGYADVAQKRPMDPTRTIIRPGSISKLFIWTAIIQLVEDKKLDLDTDVNRYLDFHIPDYKGKPITLRDIVTHRTGFAEQIKGLIGRSPPPRLGDYVKAHLPKRIYPAGQVPAYSNYASALAAYIVERVSGEQFADYAASHILAPLGMRHSTFVQPVPAAWWANTALGYRKASEPAQYYEYIGPVPAGGLNSTADDMARFMIAHLNEGMLDGHRILSAEAARELHAPQWKIFPALTTMAIGFYETTRNGHRSIAHNGGTQFFHSDLHLLVNDNVGIFISLNSAGNDDAATKIHNALFNGFMDRYFPGPARKEGAGVPSITAHKDAAMTQGYWEFSRRADGSWLSIADLFNPVFISADPNGQISFPFPARGIVHWTEIAPFIWQSPDGDKIQAITRGGKPIMIGFDVGAPASLLPVPWWRSPGWLLPALVLSLSALVLYGLALPVGAVLRWHYGLDRSPVIGNFLHRVPKLLSLALAGAAITYPLLLSQFSDDTDYFSSRTDAWVLALEALTLALLIAGSGTQIVAVTRAWKLRSSWRFRISGVVVLAALGVLWWAAIAFDLVNFSTNY